MSTAPVQEPRRPTGSLLVIQVAPDCERAPQVHDVATLAARLGGCDAAAAALARTVECLLDNAIRHSAGGAVRLALCLDPDAGDFRLQTENRATEVDAGRLSERLALLDARPAGEAVRELLVESAHGRPVGLGLARLVHDASVRIAARERDGQVQVVASNRTPSFLPSTAIQGAGSRDLALYLSHPAGGDALDAQSFARELLDRMRSGFGAAGGGPGRVESSGTGEFVRVRGTWSADPA
jgi:hypothetical protein